MEQFSPNHSQRFVFNKYTVFTMCCTEVVALRSPIPTFYDRKATDLQLMISPVFEF